MCVYIVCEDSVNSLCGDHSSNPIFTILFKKIPFFFHPEVLIVDNML